MDSERKSWNLSGVRRWGEVRMGNTSVRNRERGLEDEKRDVHPVAMMYNPTTCTNNQKSVVNRTD